MPTDKTRMTARVEKADALGESKLSDWVAPDPHDAKIASVAIPDRSCHHHNSKEDPRWLSHVPVGLFSRETRQYIAMCLSLLWLQMHSGRCLPSSQFLDAYLQRYLAQCIANLSTGT